MFFMDMPPEPQREVPVLMAQADIGKRGNGGMQGVTSGVSMPNVPPQNVPVMIAQANQDQAGNQQARDRALGVCHPVPSNYYDGENTLSPLVAVKNYFRLYDPQTTFTGPATLTVLQQPKHGVLRRVTEADRGILFDSSASKISEGHYVYLPEKGYLGDDKASFLVERGGIKVKLVIFFKAVNGPLGNTGADDYCKDTGIRWKISSTLDADGNSTITSVEYQSPIAENGTSSGGKSSYVAQLFSATYTRQIRSGRLEYAGIVNFRSEQ